MTILFSDILTDVNNGVIIDDAKVAGNLLVSTGVVDHTSEPAQADVIMYCDIPSNAKIKKLVLYNDDLYSGGTTTISIGVYASERFALSNGEVFEENSSIETSTFALAQDALNDSNNLGEDFRFNPLSLIAFSRGGFSSSNLELWELVGSGNLIEDPFKNLRIGIFIVQPTGTFIPGKSMLQVTYSGKI